MSYRNSQRIIGKRIGWHPSAYVYAEIKRRRIRRMARFERRMIALGCRKYNETTIVSPNGRVYVVSNNRWKRLSAGTKASGYRFVAIEEGGKRVYRMIHRLAALTFIPNPNGYDQVNHIDGDKNNNVIENLEWCTSAMNINHAFRTGLMLSPGVGRRKLNADDVEAIKLMDGRYKYIGEMFGVSAQTVCNIKRGYCRGNKEKRHRTAKIPA